MQILTELIATTNQRTCFPVHNFTGLQIAGAGK